MERGVHGVDSGLVKGAHTRIMVASVVHAVNTDDVDPEVLEIWNITGTSTVVGQGVDEGGGLKEGVVGIISGLAWVPERTVSRSPRQSGKGVPCG